MAFPTTNAAQELPAINQILMACGQAPVTTLDETNPDVAIAYQTLLEISREVQSEGWTFNKENHVHIEPDANDEIPILNNYLQIDLSQSNAGNKKAIIRNGKLYDKHNHTDKWTDDEVLCDILYFFDWVDLPRPIQDYIAMALEYETNQGDYSFFGQPDGAHPYVGYQPYHALKR